MRSAGWKYWPQWSSAAARQDRRVRRSDAPAVSRARCMFPVRTSHRLRRVVGLRHRPAVGNLGIAVAPRDARSCRRVLERSSHCLDGCRYDRSNPGPEIRPKIRIRCAGSIATARKPSLFDERGPGAVTRFWVTTGFGVSTCIDPAIRVRFYVDGAVVPTLDVPLAALFDGSTPPFTAPLVADRTQASGGYVSYVPIAYARALRIALTSMPTTAARIHAQATTSACCGSRSSIIALRPAPR